MLTDGCLKAADEAPEENLREQFRLCLKSVAAAVNTFCGSIKFLKDRPTETNYRACQVCRLYLEDSGVLECNTVSLGQKFLTFKQNMVPSCARVKRSKKNSYSSWTASPLKSDWQAAAYTSDKCLK